MRQAAIGMIIGTAVGAFVGAAVQADDEPVAQAGERTGSAPDRAGPTARAARKRDRAWLSLVNPDKRQIVVGNGVAVRPGTFRGHMTIRAVPERGDHVLRVVYTSKEGKRFPFTFDAHIVPR